MIAVRSDGGIRCVNRLLMYNPIPLKYTMPQIHVQMTDFFSLCFRHHIKEHNNQIVSNLEFMHGKSGCNSDTFDEISI